MTDILNRFKIRTLEDLEMLFISKYVQLSSSQFTMFVDFFWSQMSK